MSREELLSRWGFETDPFATFSAELETRTEQFFLPPPYFRDITGDPENPNSTIVFGARGEGKSTLFEMVSKALQGASPRTPLQISYTDFSDLSEKSMEEALLPFHIENIFRRAVLLILDCLSQDPTLLKKLDSHELSDLHWFILWLFSPDPNGVELKFTKIKNIAYPMGKLRSGVSKIGGALHRYLRRRRFALEHTADSESTAVQIAKAFAILLPETPGSKEIRHESTLDRLKRFINVLQALGFASFIVLIDRVDESPAATKRPELATKLVEPLLTSLPLLELKGFAIKFFLPLIVRDQLGGDVRTDRIRTRDISWSDETLEILLLRRLSAFSDGHVNSIESLFNPTEAAQLRRELFVNSARRPRDMLRLLDHVVSDLCESETEPRFISGSAFQLGLTKFRAERLRDYDAADYEERVREARDRLSGRYPASQMGQQHSARDAPADS
jgi:hypothetical protein